MVVYSNVHHKFDSINIKTIFKKILEEKHNFFPIEVVKDVYPLERER